MSQKPSLDQLFLEFRAFCEENYPEAVAEDYLTKLDEEVQELKEAPSMEELVDCMMVLVGLSRFLDGDLEDEFHKKLEKNRSRRWARMPNGTYRHL